MAEDFYPFVDSGDPAPTNDHLNARVSREDDAQAGENPNGPKHVTCATRISVYDDMFSTPRVIVIERDDVRTYLEEVTNTVYRTMKEQGGKLSLMVIRELVENFIHAHFVEPVISILDDGNTIRFADQGPGITDKERAFEFGVTSADREQKRYIRGTGSGLPMIQQYLEHAGGAISIEDNLNQGTVVTVSVDAARVAELAQTVSRGAAVRCAEAGATAVSANGPAATAPYTGGNATMGMQTNPAAGGYPQNGVYPMGAAYPASGMQMPQSTDPYGYPLAGGQLNAGGGAAPQNYPAAAQVPGWGGAPAAATTGGTMPGAPMPGMKAGMQPFPPATAAANPQQLGGMPPAAGPGASNAYPQQYIVQQNGAGTYPMPQAPQGPASNLNISERGMLALRYLAEHGSAGPTDLTNAFGDSTPTWSRELSALASTGMVCKQGQKRVLTDMGRAWMQQQV